MIAPLFQIPCETWGNWMNTGSCSVTCDQGNQPRIRICIGGVAGSGGCPGSATDTITCFLSTCPSLTMWSMWSICSRSCGSGFSVSFFVFYNFFLIIFCLFCMELYKSTLMALKEKKKKKV